MIRNVHPMQLCCHLQALPKAKQECISDQGEGFAPCRGRAKDELVAYQGAGGLGRWDFGVQCCAFSPKPQTLNLFPFCRAPAVYGPRLRSCKLFRCFELLGSFEV